MVDEHESTTDVIVEPAPEAKPKRRRATKKAAAPTDVEGYAAAPSSAAGEASAEVVTAKDEAEAESAPKARATAKRATRKPAKRAKAVPVSEPEPEVADAGPEAEPEETEPEETEPEETEGQDAAPTLGVASFGLLFQAPDTTVRRSRRATAPVQAPPPKVEVPVADEEAAASTDADADVDASDAEPTGEAAGPEDETGTAGARRRRSRGGRGRRSRAAEESDASADAEPTSAQEADTESEDSDIEADDSAEESSRDSSRRRRRRRRSGTSSEAGEDPPGTVTRVRAPRSTRDEPTAVKGSTRLEAKKQRRREGREAGRRRTIITEAEFLARREAVDRVMVVRGHEDRTQIGVLEDGILVEHYVSRETATTMVGNVYLGRVQNVLPSMEAAFVDIGKGRNAVLYAGEVNWDAAGLEVNQAKRIENALSSGDTVLVQVTKDPIGHKGARLTSQISLPGRFLVYVPEGSMTGISRKLPDTERARLKAILKEIVPDSAGVIVRTAAEGASEEELRADVERLTKAWEKISSKAEKASAKKAGSGGAPTLVHGEPDLTVRVIRDIFTEDFSSLVVSGDRAWSEVSDYVEDVAPDLAQRLSHWTSEEDLFTYHRVQEQIAKAMDRKVWLPSGGSLVIDRTEAMTVVDVNTGKFVGSGGNLEETVTKNNIEAAEEIVRQLRLRDIGGIIVIDFIDMVLESNRDLVVRRLLECLGRDRTKHQVAEVTSLGLVQMTRKRVGSGLIEVFSESCEHCSGRGIIVHAEPIDKRGDSGPVQTPGAGSGSRGRARGRSDSGANGSGGAGSGTTEAARKPSGPTAAQIAAAAHAAAVMTAAPAPVADSQDIPAEEVHEVDGDEHVSSSIDEQRGSVDASEALEVTPALAVDAEPAQASPDVVDTADDVAEAVAEAVAHDLETPVVRPKRRRGRVVAPAGPPAGDLAAPTASP